MGDGVAADLKGAAEAPDLSRVQEHPAGKDGNVECCSQAVLNKQFG